MNQPLEPLEQISYILLHDRKHEKSEATPLIDGIIEMHENYLRDEKEFIKAIEMERERLVYNTRLKVAEEKGKEEGIEVGLKQGKIESAKTIIQSIYTEENLDWIEGCQEEQLDKIFTYIMQNLDYDVFKQKVLE